MDPTPFVRIARIVKAHGTRGELGAASLGDELDLLPRGLEVWFVPPPDRPRSGRLEHVRPGPKGPLITVTGVNAPEKARQLAGTYLLARRTDLPSDWLPEEPLDLNGYQVLDVERGLIGTVEDTIVTGANDVWVVRGEGFGEVLIPVIDDVVRNVDESHRRIEVTLLPGLLDEES